MQSTAISIADRVEARRAKRRNRSKISQRKYRANQKASNTQLVEDVRELEMNNLRLEARLSVLHERQGVSQCIASIKEYLQLFEHGYNPRGGDVGHTNRQEAFVHKFVTPNVDYNGKIGVDYLLDQWATYYALFESFRIEWTTIQVLTVDEHAIVLETTVFMHVLVTDTSVCALFPRLAQHRADLADKLVGTKLTVPLRALFTHDAHTHQVTRVQATASVAVALVKHLNSVEEASEALLGALLDDNLLLELQHQHTP
ncbi:hypothetical protein DYB25_005065 [Aphanomyces astaci]|uniref:BZIP domain-containing protein n=1 Tax=Aphanomyces astaci TaxID=112090 RepID=A0A396ZT76_APHAT|nr:hypothetical protein DYB25_005065 [Aphanomyces astaci]RHY70875.1 hypothetical protein DYB38_012107 [Aphanomyces astaci]RHZ20420.1 hypothetical protein DYB26_002952 [Aphanomyces astaci]